MTTRPLYMLLVDPVDAYWIGEDLDGTPADAAKVDQMNAKLAELAAERWPGVEVRMVPKPDWVSYMASTGAGYRHMVLGDLQRHDLYLAAVDLVLR